MQDKTTNCIYENRIFTPARRLNVDAKVNGIAKSLKNTGIQYLDKHGSMVNQELPIKLERIVRRGDGKRYREISNYSRTRHPFLHSQSIEPRSRMPAYIHFGTARYPAVCPQQAENFHPLPIIKDSLHS